MKQIIFTVLVLSTFCLQSQAEENMLNAISTFESIAQQELEKMVVSGSMHTQHISSTIAYFSEKISKVSASDALLANEILARIAHAVTLVELRA